MTLTSSQISKWLRQERERAGLARRPVSVHLDVSERSVVRWEDPEDEALPPADHFLALVVLYKANIMQLLARKIEPKGAAGAGTSVEPERKRKLG